MSDFPIILIPSTIQQIKSAQPNLPPSPSVPFPPRAEPEKVNTSIIAVETVTVTVPSVALAAQEGGLIPGAMLFFASITAIAAQTWRQITNYQKRKQKYENKVAIYYQKLEEYKQKKVQYEEEVKIRITDFQYKLLLEILRQTESHDGNGSKARRGWSEATFQAKLNQYFPAKIHTGLILNIPNFPHPYTPDFAYIDKTINLYLDIEIDEPYVYKTKEPTHYLGSGKDKKRNEFFLEKNWIVIRFSEEQIVCFPESCCKTIAQIVFQLTKDNLILNQFNNVSDLAPIRQWTELEAKQMAAHNGRQKYLS